MQTPLHQSDLLEGRALAYCANVNSGSPRGAPNTTQWGLVYIYTNFYLESLQIANHSAITSVSVG